MALHGLQQRLGSKYGYVRYADDLIVCANTREQIDIAKSLITDWLSERGLTLHPEKTRVVHVDNGLNFLGFSIKRYRGKCLIKPQMEKVRAFLANIRSWLNKHKQAKTENVIRHLNPILRGWSNNYKHVVSKRIFSFVSHEIWKMLWKWCLRRHSEKGKDWVRRKYFGSNNNSSWSFQARCGNETLYLFDVSRVPIERHIKVRGAASPDDPHLHEYWRKRRETRPGRKKGLDARAV